MRRDAVIPPAPPLVKGGARSAGGLHERGERADEETSARLPRPEDWPAWIAALQASSQRLQKLGERSDWAGMRAELSMRDFLLEKTLPELMSTRQFLRGQESQTEREQVKVALAELLESDRELLGELGVARQELAAKINQVKKGRKTLTLYRSHRVPPPRFCDRFG